MAVIVAAIINLVHDEKKAAARGITLEQLYEEKRAEMDRQEMYNGLEVEYLGGYPLWPRPGKVNFSVRGTIIELKKGDERFMLPKEAITGISTEKSVRRSAGKAAAGAIIGGQLFGRAGMIAGGALGGRINDTSELYITYIFNRMELDLKLRTGKNTDKVYAWINTVFA